MTIYMKKKIQNKRKIIIYQLKKIIIIIINSYNDNDGNINCDDEGGGSGDNFKILINCLWIDESNMVHKSYYLFRILKELVNDNAKNIKIYYIIIY